MDSYLEIQYLASLRRIKTDDHSRQRTKEADQGRAWQTTHWKGLSQKSWDWWEASLRATPRGSREASWWEGGWKSSGVKEANRSRKVGSRQITLRRKSEKASWAEVELHPWNGPCKATPRWNGGGKKTSKWKESTGERIPLEDARREREV